MSGYIGTQPVPQATQTRDIFTATAGQTSFPTGGYTPQFLDVYLNGVHLQNSVDYTAANGSDVVLTTGAALGDVLEVVAYSTFDSANTYNRTEADAEFVNDPDDVIAVSSGRVGINTTSPDFALHVQDAGSNAAATVKLGDVYHGYVQQNANTLNIISNGDQEYRAGLGTNNGSGNIVFQTASNTTGNTERMRISRSGNLLVGTTTNTTTSKIITTATSGVANGVGVNCTTTASTGAMVFFNPNGQVGTINVTGTSTSYVTSSDYRLKTDAQPMTGASARVQALKPVNFEWIADGTRVDGFIAHEAQEVVPEAVTGTKDAMRDEEYEVTPAVLDDDGNVVTEAVMGTQSVPDYQGIDQSKLVPLLTAALQEALTKIDELETRITALESN
jgi:hypothetical protein